MKTKFYLLVFSMIIQANIFSQTNKANNKKNDPLHLTKEQKLADSIKFERFRKENPERFLFNRLPVKLIDGSYAVTGFSTGIEIKNNHVKDSVYHNFHPGMPDTSTIIPFNDIKVTDEHVMINLFSHLLLSGGRDRDSSAITQIEKNEIKKEWNLPLGDFLNNYAIKISINGKLLFDWKLIGDFSKQVFKTSEKFKDHGGMYGYNYGYAICDTSLHINDQLLIEIKNTKNNWLIDRYNITRVAIAPEIALLIPLNEKDEYIKRNNTFAQKKTLIQMQKQQK